MSESDLIDFRDDEECFDVANEYHSVTYPKFRMPDNLISFDEYAKVFGRLPHLATRDDLDMFRIKLFSWNKIKRPHNESKVYRENEVYRNIVDKYDSVKSLLGTFGNDDYLQQNLKSICQLFALNK